jgi:hypothetical protein
MYCVARSRCSKCTTDANRPNKTYVADPKPKHKGDERGIPVNATHRGVDPAVRPEKKYWSRRRRRRWFEFEPSKLNQKRVGERKKEGGARHRHVSRGPRGLVGLGVEWSVWGLVVGDQTDRQMSG